MEKIPASPSPLQYELTEDEETLLINYILAHKTEYIQDFFRERNLPFSGTKSVIQERLKERLSSGKINISELTELLNTIEGWGRQYIYLYSNNTLINKWQDEEMVIKKLSNLGLSDLFNRPRPLVLPDGTILCSIEWTPERTRFIWVSSHQYEVRGDPGQDIKGEGINQNKIWKLYEIKYTRRLTTFDWDLVSGEAMLMIQSMPKGANYSQIKKQIENELEPIIPISEFEPVQVSQSIQQIEESGEARRRWLAYDTLQGGRAEFRSYDSEGDTYSDPALKRASIALREERAGWLGDFYWNPVENILSIEFHTKLSARDQSIYIYGQHKEFEVRYAISRIRSYC